MRHFQRWLAAVLLCALLPASAAVLASTNWYYEVDKQSPWQGDVDARIIAIEEVFGGALGVYVQNLARNSLKYKHEFEKDKVIFSE